MTTCDEPLIGTFYEFELIYVHGAKERHYEIEAFLDEKKIGKDKYIYVKWRNYPNSKHCNQWILKDSLVDA